MSTILSRKEVNVGQLCLMTSTKPTRFANTRSRSCSILREVPHESFSLLPKARPLRQEASQRWLHEKLAHLGSGSTSEWIERTVLRFQKKQKFYFFKKRRNKYYTSYYHHSPLCTHVSFPCFSCSTREHCFCMFQRDNVSI